LERVGRDQEAPDSKRRVLSGPQALGRTLILVMVWIGMTPGAMWLFMGWGLNFRLEFAVGFLLPTAVAMLGWWSLGLAHTKGLEWKRPRWVVHRGLKFFLVMFGGTFFTAFPFARSTDKAVEATGLLVAPAVGVFFAVVYIVVALLVSRPEDDTA
jgi:hypothetical protein